MLLQREPFAAFTQAQVAVEAGVRQSHLTYYFPTRNDLLRGVAQAAKEEAVAQSREDSSQRGPSLRQLRQRVGSQTGSPALPRLMVALTTASDEDANLRPWLEHFERDSKARLKAALAALGLHVRAAPLDLCHAALVGAALLNFQQRSASANRRAVRVCTLAFDRLVADARRV